MEQDDVAKGQSGKQNVGMRAEGLEPSGPRAKRARVSMLRHTASSLELQTDVVTDNEDEQPEQLDLQATQVRSQTFADMEDADRLRHHAHTRDATATAKEIHEGIPDTPAEAIQGDEDLAGPKTFEESLEWCSHTMRRMVPLLASHNTSWHEIGFVLSCEKQLVLTTHFSGIGTAEAAVSTMRDALKDITHMKVPVMTYSSTDKMRHVWMCSEATQET